VNRRHSRSLRESAGVLAELRRRNGLLFVVTLVHLGLAGLFTVLMQADGRMLLGQNVWAKPWKFAISIAIVTATIGWILPSLSPYCSSHRSPRAAGASTRGISRYPVGSRLDSCGARRRRCRRGSLRRSDCRDGRPGTARNAARLRTGRSLALAGRRCGLHTSAHGLRVRPRCHGLEAEDRYPVTAPASHLSCSGPPANTQVDTAVSLCSVRATEVLPQAAARGR